MDNKERFDHFIRVATLIIWGSLAIGVGATALNAFPGKFLSAVAILNWVATGIAMWKIIKLDKLFSDKK